MKRLVLITLALVGGLLYLNAAEDKPRTLGTIERLDPAFDDLVAKDAVLEILGDGYNWVEGPVWDKKAGHLLFSDIPSNSVYKFKPGEKISLFLRPSGYTGTREDLMEPGSNGLLFDPKGRLVLMQHGDRCVARLNDDGKTFTRLVEKVGDKRLNSPNDGAFKSNADLYFTDPPYGQMRKGKPWIFPDEELGYRGVYRLTPEGKLTLLTKELEYPNGLAFSPDEKFLYVAQSNPKKAIWMKFPVKEDGTIGEGKILFDSTKFIPDKKGLPDGLKVDVKGNLWATGPGGVLILTQEGKHLGTIATGVPTSNCGFGDDGTTLYVTADKALCRIKTKTKGVGF
ncbi:MAG: SMP-30/gluconolactonase/LRE family protein [Planctomycetia bacterium]|nr:SMP-30/gluconolactonase/LRE family protein [Planctomycetia bacterium]